MKSLIVVLTLLVSILGVISKDIRTSGAEVRNEIHNLPVNGDILDNQIQDFNRRSKPKPSKPKPSKPKPSKPKPTTKPTSKPTTKPTSQSTTTPTSFVWTNGDCYKNDEPKLYSKKDTSDLTTIRSCMNLCKREIGPNGTTFEYYGLENGDTCYCGSIEPPTNAHPVVPQINCNIPCSGDAAKKCGGKDFINVYKVPKSSSGGTEVDNSSLMEATNTPKNMPNVNYFLRGYNIMKGNPHQVSVSTVDPGFQEPIFSLRYNQGGETPDGRYLQPDGTLITMCQSCSLSAVTKITSGMTDYIDSLSEKVKVTGRYGLSWPWWEHRFSWSKEYKNIHRGIYQYSNYYTHSDESCCAYQIQTDTYSRPPFSQNFIDGVKTLPSQYVENEAIYRKFIEAFGTHYIKQADMGSLFGQQTKISKEFWQDMVDRRWNIERISSWSAMFASETHNFSYDAQSSSVFEFNHYASSQLLYTKGSKPPKGRSIQNWIDETKKYPAPISLELGSILDLFDDDDFKRENMKLALDNYCGSNCEEQEDDPWLTNLSIGQRSEPKSCDGGTNVTWVQFSRDTLWVWPSDGLYDLCFKCSNDDTKQCFNPDTPPPAGYLGFEMICPENGFERMTTFTPDFYDDNPINVKAHCNRDAEPQYAFYDGFVGTWAPWVSCHHDSKITGFQVLRNYDDKIINFRIKCE